MTFLRKKSNSFVLMALAAIFAVTCVISLFSGPTRLPLAEVWGRGIFWIRLARTIMAAVAGAGLSVAGVVFQSLLRNPLAEPYVLGVTAGSAVCAALAIITGLATVGLWTMPGMAFCGALATILLVRFLARTRSGAVPVETLLLAGVTLSAVLNSLLMFLVSVAPSEKLHGVVWWLLGNLQVTDWPLLVIVGVAVTAGLIVCMVFSRDLNLLALGEESAAHLGLDVERSRRLFFIVASLITGATVASCGLIGFVGLIVPHAVRKIVGPDHRRLVAATALGGAAFLVVADCIARSAIGLFCPSLGPVEIPIGVVTALTGGPLFLGLLQQRKASGN